MQFWDALNDINDALFPFINARLQPDTETLKCWSLGILPHGMPEVKDVKPAITKEEEEEEELHNKGKKKRAEEEEKKRLQELSEEEKQVTVLLAQRCALDSPKFLEYYRSFYFIPVTPESPPEFRSTNIN